MAGQVCGDRSLSYIGVSNLARRTAYECEVRRTAASAWALLTSIQATSGSYKVAFHNHTQ